MLSRLSALRLLGLARRNALRGTVLDPKRRKRRGGSATEPLPVEPHRPNNLTGGAAAALEFDE